MFFGSLEDINKTSPENTGGVVGFGCWCLFSVFCEVKALQRCEALSESQSEAKKETETALGKRDGKCLQLGSHQLLMLACVFFLDDFLPFWALNRPCKVFCKAIPGLGEELRFHQVGPVLITVYVFYLYCIGF